MIVFSFKGMQVEIRFLFVATVTLCLLLDQSQVALYGMIASLMHEAGHIVACSLTGCRPKRISFEMTGIALHKSTCQLSYGQEFLVLLAGSATNLCFFFGTFCLVGGDFDRMGVFSVVHLAIGLVNLLPVSALDGGKILRLLLLQIGAEKQVNNALFFIQIVIIFMVLIFCILFILQGKINFSLLVLAFYLISMVLTEQN